MVSRNTTVSLLLVALIALAGALGCTGGGNPIDTGAGVTSDRTASDGILSGKLTDPSGDPLAWAELYIDGEIAGWTGEDGSYAIYGVDQNAEITLEAKIDGETVYTSVIGPAARNGQNFEDNDPSIERGKVWGFVADQLGPVPHALVVVFNKSENFGVDFTDEKGYYEIPDAPAGQDAIVAFAPKHATAKDFVLVIPNGEVQKNLFMPAKLDFGIVGGIVITGPIGDPKPIPFANVSLMPIGVPGAQPIFTKTNKYGAYMFPPVPLGMVEVRAFAPLFNFGLQVVDVKPGQNMVNFHLEPASTGIEGSVKDPEGQPIPKALVRISRTDPNDPGKPPFVVQMPTNEFGLYRFAPLFPGKYTVECGKLGFIPFKQGDVPVFLDQFTVVDIVLTPK